MTLDELKIIKRKFVETEFEGVKVTIREHPGRITACKV